MKQVKEWMISPVNEGQEEVVCDVGYEKNFPEHCFVHVVEKSAYDKLAQELDSYKSLLQEITPAWKEHQQTKFKPDGSHFQADIKLNELVERIKEAITNEKV